jgi:hypothetical protein
VEERDSHCHGRISRHQTHTNLTRVPWTAPATRRPRPPPRRSSRRHGGPGRGATPPTRTSSPQPSSSSSPPTAVPRTSRAPSTLYAPPLPSPLSDSCVLSSDDGLSLARAAGRRPGHRLAGDPVHLLHALLRGRVARGHPAGQRACTRPRHQRLPALHPRQPRPGMVRVSWLLIGIRLSKRAGKHG